MARQRRYSNEDVARGVAVLEANGGKMRQAAREANVPFSTMKDWAHGVGTSTALAPPAETRSEQRRILDAEYEAEAFSAIDHARTVRDKASYLQAITAAGICTDKMRVLRELPDHITGQSGPATLEERNALLLELLTEALAKIQQGQVPPTAAALRDATPEPQTDTLDGSFLPDVSEDA